MAKYNEAFSHWLDTKTKFYLHTATYEELESARIKYLKEKNRFFTNI